MLGREVIIDAFCPEIDLLTIHKCSCTCTVNEYGLCKLVKLLYNNYSLAKMFV
jgi:hypothetical protein